MIRGGCARRTKCAALGAAFTIDGWDDYIIDIRLSGRSTERSVSVASSRARVGYHRDIRFDKISDEGLGLRSDNVSKHIQVQS